MTDDELMGLALEEAMIAGAAGDVPVGAVIVGPGVAPGMRPDVVRGVAAGAGWGRDVAAGAGLADGDTVIGRGRNRREVTGDPTAHAEIEALRSAAKHLGHWRVEATLVVTQEPCPMCAGALVNARVRRLVYGCPNPKAGAVHTLYQLCSDPRLNHRVEVVAGVRADEAAALLRGFFAKLRREGQK
jgi:tRNA(adenine34) deaminase